MPDLSMISLSRHTQPLLYPMNPNMMQPPPPHNGMNGMMNMQQQQQQQQQPGPQYINQQVSRERALRIIIFNVKHIFLL
jgi:hypothetical protein